MPKAKNQSRGGAKFIFYEEPYIYMLEIHRKAIDNVINEWKKDPKVLCILLYGSVARGTANKNSDIDIEVFREGGKTRHIETKIDGVDIDLYVYPVKKIIEHVKKNPFLTYPYLEEKILFERKSFATKIIGSINEYFNENKEIKNFWKVWTKEYLENKKNAKKIRDVDEFYKEVKKLFSDKKKIKLPF
ncbi:nucleotidyltransferase domain-containing protein [Candidatus Pacearchaeota archaeon]|nr:nucleotidyltransferase domain-containing protein [Candidatus Pacearchaeota archaeon]